MSQPDRPKQLLQRYVDTINGGDTQALMNLFDENAVVEDPAGSTPMRGRTEWEPFYRAALAQGVRIEVEGALRGSHANSAAMAFKVHAAGFVISAIEVMTFDDSERIIGMIAYYSPSDIEQSA